MITIQITDQENGRKCWQELLGLYLKAGTAFEIYCWRNEKEEIDTVMEAGGIPEDTQWEYGTVMKGILTGTFIQRILRWKPGNDEIYEKFSQFYALQVGGIWSEHYGRELYIEQEPEQKAELYQVLERIAPFAKISQVTEGVG